MARPRSKSNIILHKTFAEIECKHANAVIDLSMVNKIKNLKWFSKKSKYGIYFYSHATGSKKYVLHRFLLDVTTKQLVVDHKDGDTLNNKLDNLRVCTRLQNNVNSKKRKNCKSKYKGLMLRPSGNWGVYIKKGSKNYCLGTFSNEKEAAMIYNKKALELFGEFAKLNNVKE